MGATAKLSDRLAGVLASRGFGYLLLLLYAYCLVVNAWLCDDSYITFRVIDNFLHGFGLTWNTAERVQAYTHPLWMFLLVPFHALTGEPYYSTIFVSLALAAAIGGLLFFRLARPGIPAVLGVSLLILSKAYMDYATFGLENTLSIFLLALFFLVYFAGEHTPRRVFSLSLLACLLMLSRLDLSLVVAPALAAVLYKNLGWKTAGLLALGMLPLLGWEIFSLLYYGFPFPNTAYAKLNNGFSSLAALGMGFAYLRQSLYLDHVGLPVIGLFLIGAVLPGNRRLLPLAAGVFLYLLYIIKIGGDFMCGRFLDAIFFVSIVGLTRLELPDWKRRGPLLLAAFIALGLTTRYAPVFSSASYGQERMKTLFDNDHNMIDERAFYYPHTGLLAVGLSRSDLPDSNWAILGREARQKGLAVSAFTAVGFMGYYAGPGVHVLDHFALADPLLARLPPVKQEKSVPGHLPRYAPPGYYQSLLSGRNEVLDPGVRKYYEQLRLITRGRIWTTRRLLGIIGFNLGRYDDLISGYDASCPRVSGRKILAPTDYPPEAVPGGMTVRFDLSRVVHGRRLEMRFKTFDRFLLRYLRGGREVGRRVVLESPEPAYRSWDPGTVNARRKEIFVEPEVYRAGYDAVVVYPLTGTGYFSASLKDFSILE